MIITQYSVSDALDDDYLRKYYMMLNIISQSKHNYSIKKSVWEFPLCLIQNKPD